jgi:UDP-2,3-diacylglucosamine pyrophosphatase LpxH
VPHASELRLSPDARVCLLSDLHLGDGGRSDPFAGKDARLRRFFDEVASRADAVILVGDGFDLAQAWTMARIEAAHRRLLDDLRALARSVDTYYVRGNHEGDGRVVARTFPELVCCERVWIGEHVLVEHGNAFDPHNRPGDRRAFWGSRAHAMLEKAIGSPVRVPMRKHHHWSTRLGHWLFYRYGQYRLGRAHLLRLLQRPAAAQRELAFLDYWGRGEWGDNAGLLGAAERFLVGPDVSTLVCGHSHQPGQVAVEGGTYLNTGSWTFAESTYAWYEDGRFEVRHYPDERVVRDEEYRAFLADRDRTFFDWWDAFYLGRFRYDVAAMEAELARPGSHEGVTDAPT